MHKLNLKEFTENDETIELNGVPFILTMEIPARALAEIEGLQNDANMTNLMSVVRRFLVKNDKAKVDALLDEISVNGLTKLMQFLSTWFTEKMKVENDKKKDSNQSLQ